jgi:hypothetical protein
MDTVDTRKTEDKQTELLSQMYTKGIFVHQADRAAAGTMAKSVSTDVIAVTNAMQPVLDGIETFSKAFAQQLGSTKQFTEGLSGFKTTTSTFLAGLPLSLDTVISGIKTAQETFDKTLNKVGEINILGVNLKDFATGTAMPDFTVNTAAITVKGVVEKNDAVMMHDGVVNFNPRDKFTRVNDCMTVAGTNVGGIDRFAAQMEKRDAKFEQTMTRLISTMASQTKAALESANIKITPDRTFSSNSLNKGRYA